MHKNNFVVSVKHKKNICREVDGNVYLPFGSEYSLYLKNLNSDRAVVTVTIDGEDVLDGNALVIPANSSTTLAGFMQESRVLNRFKFIKKTKRIREYRGDKPLDGLITVKIKYEKPMVFPTFTYGCNDYPTKSRYHNTCFSSELLCSSNDGITTKGTPISEQYDYTTIGVLDDKATVITLQLLGKTKQSKIKVVKPRVVKRKITCSLCGKKNKSSYKFCTECGTCLL